MSTTRLWTGVKDLGSSPKLPPLGYASLGKPLNLSVPSLFPVRFTLWHMQSHEDQMRLWLKIHRDLLPCPLYLTSDCEGSQWLIKESPCILCLSH